MVQLRVLFYLSKFKNSKKKTASELCTVLWILDSDYRRIWDARFQNDVIIHLTTSKYLHEYVAIEGISDHEVSGS